MTTTYEPTTLPMPADTIEPEGFLSLADSIAYELVDGRLVERHMGAESCAIAAAIISILRPFVRANRLGHVFTSEAVYQCFRDAPKKMRRPDVSFVRRDRFANGELPKGQIRVVPELVVEVISPGDGADDVQDKVDEYIAAGVPLVWVVYPSGRTVTIHRPATAAPGRITRLTTTDTIGGEDVIPGFTCRIAEFFEND